MKIATSADIYKLCWNLIIFVTFQTLFFNIISSQFTLNLIKDKISDISNFVTYQLNSTELLYLRNELITRKTKLEPIALSKAMQRNENNVKFLISKTSPWIIPSFGIMLISFLIAFTSPEGIKLEDISLLFIILLSYVTEVGMFYGMFSRHNYIGTYELIKNINSKLPENNKMSINQWVNFN